MDKPQTATPEDKAALKAAKNPEMAPAKPAKKRVRLTDILKATGK